MITDGRIRIIEEELMATNFNQNNIKLAFYLKMLDERQFKALLNVSEANYAEIMDIIQDTNHDRREQKINALMKKHKKKEV